MPSNTCTMSLEMGVEPARTCKPSGAEVATQSVMPGPASSAPLGSPIAKWAFEGRGYSTCSSAGVPKLTVQFTALGGGALEGPHEP